MQQLDMYIATILYLYKKIICDGADLDEAFLDEVADLNLASYLPTPG